MIKLSLLVAPCFLLATFQLSVTMIESFEDDASSISSYSSYGVDVSFPIHHESSTSINYDYLPHNALPSLYPTPQSYRDMPLQPLGDRQAVYQEFLQGCVDFYSNSNKCGDYERDRVTMNLRQPQSMINYTDMGFQKVPVPKNVWDPIRRFWERNKENWKPERWPEGNTYTNHWKAPTYLVNIEDSSLRGGGSHLLKQAIVEGTRGVVEEWSGQAELTERSLYGIRIYTEEAMLNSHVDRLPYVFSAVINVDQDLDEPWPMEVIGHDGKANNVTLKPGEMLLYESHSIIHGRPFALKGRYMANLFVHYEPVGHSSRHHNHDTTSSLDEGISSQYRKAIQEGTGGHEAASDAANGLPPYLLPDSPEESHYREEHSQHDIPQGDSTDQTLAHTLAAEGRINELIELIEEEKHLIHATDANGWTALHEGARWGHVDVVRFLVEQGADIHLRSKNGTGGSVMFYAKMVQGPNSPVVLLLERLGAISVEPDPEL